MAQVRYIVEDVDAAVEFYVFKLSLNSNSNSVLPSQYCNMET